MYNTKNYSTDGGDTTVIGGTLRFEDGATVENFPGGDPSPTPDPSPEPGGVGVHTLTVQSVRQGESGGRQIDGISLYVDDQLYTTSDPGEGETMADLIAYLSAHEGDNFFIKFASTPATRINSSFTGATVDDKYYGEIYVTQGVKEFIGQAFAATNAGHVIAQRLNTSNSLEPVSKLRISVDANGFAISRFATQFVLQ